MALVAINWKPDRKTLAEFSEAWLFFLGMVGAPLAYFRGHPRLAAALWLAAVIGRLLGLVRPQWMRPAFLGLTLLTFPIGWVVSNVVLALLYFGVFTPVALIFRLIGRDALKRTLDRQAPTYWEPYQPGAGGMRRYLRPF